MEVVDSAGGRTPVTPVHCTGARATVAAGEYCHLGTGEFTREEGAPRRYAHLVVGPASVDFNPPNLAP